MVIDNFNILGCARRPTEANAKLIVDAYAPLPDAVARKLFQTIRGRSAHILDAPRQINLDDFWLWAVMLWRVEHIPHVSGVVVETPGSLSV